MGWSSLAFTLGSISFRPLKHPCLIFRNPSILPSDFTPTPFSVAQNPLLIDLFRVETGLRLAAVSPPIPGRKSPCSSRARAHSYFSLFLGGFAPSTPHQGVNPLDPRPPAGRGASPPFQPPSLGRSLCGGDFNLPFPPSAGGD